MKAMKKNQVVVFVIALMLIAAGYLNFTTNQKNSLETAKLADSEQTASIGDATLVSANVADTINNTTEEIIQNQEVQEVEEKNDMSNSLEETNVITSSTTAITEEKKTTSDNYFTESRLERDTMYSQMIESYQKILNNVNMTESQKVIAQNEIKNINTSKNAIMITENLIKTKGFQDVLLFINDESVNVIIQASELTPQQIAQIQNIVMREMKAEIENIHIIHK